MEYGAPYGYVEYVEYVEFVEWNLNELEYGYMTNLNSAPQVLLGSVHERMIAAPIPWETWGKNP